MKTIQLVEKATKLTHNVNTEAITAFFDDGRDVLVIANNGSVYVYSGSESQLANAL